MKLKNLVKRITAWALVCITVAGSTPAVDIHAEDTSNSKVDIYATQSSDYLITIPKQLILDGKSGTGAYRVSVKGNISGTDIITVTPDERFFMKQEGKTDILTTIEQIKTQFTYADGVRPEVEVTADGKVQMEKISAGKWTGLFNFNITSSVDLESEDSVGSTIDDIKGNGTGKDTAQNKYSEYITTGAIVNIPVSAKNEKGEDINATSSNIVGSKAEDLLDSLKETGHIEDTEEVDALIEVKSDDFDGLAETTFDVSNIAQPGDEVIILHYDETKQMWEFIGQETVGEDGTVKGDFTSYSPVAFVKVDKHGNLNTHHHDYKTHMKDASCLEDGLLTYLCKECDHLMEVTLDKLGHDYIESVIPPTCTEEGYTLHVCSRCDDEYTDTKVPATGHTVVKVGTSEIHEKCSVCGVILSDKHTFTSEVATQPTCTEKGYTKYTCECGYNHTEQDIPALGHTVVNGGTVSIHSKCSVCNATLSENHTYEESIVSDATCTISGLKKYTCDCGYSYTEEVAILGHSYGDYVTTTEATCTADGVKTKTCTVCGNKETAVITKLGHNYSTTYTIDKEATCTTDGSKSQHCSRCDAKQNVTKIPAKGHTLVNGGTSAIHTKCSVCNEILSTKHTYTNKVTKEPTCTNDGVRTYTCSCGHSYTEVVTKTGHTEVNGGTENVHTKCSVCGVTLNAQHTYTSKVTTEATCTVMGTTTYTCACGYSHSKQDIPATGHSYGTVSYSWTGYTACKASRTCGNCSNIETENGTITNAVTKEATCTATGTRTYTAKFTNSAFATQTKTETIAKNASNHTGSVVNAGTSSVHTKYSCCGATVSSTHSYTVDSGVQYSAATCTAPRYNYNSCSCGYNPKSASYVVAIGSATGHSYGSYSTTTAATCTTDGVKTRTCSVCGAKDTASITKLGHNFSSSYTVDKAATCTTAGSKSQHCSRCSATQNVTAIPATGHSYGTPTYTWTGYTACKASRTCGNCSNVETENGTITNAVTKEATCTATGTRTYTAKFSNTAFATQTKTETIANKHNYVNNKCSICGTNKPGLYDASGIILCEWEDSGIDINKSYNSTNYKTTESSPYYVLTNIYPSCDKIVLPENVTSISTYAFYNCSGLTSITIPNSVTSIGSYAFKNCSGLTSFTIPNSVTSINGSLFSGCSGLTSIAIPNSVTSISSSAFYNCKGLTSITIPNSVTSIASYAFQNCSNLTSITIPDGVTSIGNSTFSGCSGLTSITIPNSVTSIGNNAFYNCRSLTSITIPDGVTSIGDAAFSGCSGLTSITIPNSVTSIGNYAFQNCSGLTSITIPNSVTSIGNYLFSGCSSLTSITIPNSVTSIGNYAFYNCKGLTSITIPNSVTSIGNSAFSGCSGLTSFTIPDGVTSIDGYLFSGCSALISITIPNSVTSIKSNAFYNCRSLTSITIPDGVTSIGNSAFSGCSGLTNITIPDGVTSIGNGTFYNCSGLTSITIPDGVTSIGNNAFYNCNRFSSITIPDGVTSIGNYAFYCCNIVNINIPESVTSIGEYAFQYNRFSSITIPDGIISIGMSAFAKCSGLKSITYKGIIHNDSTSLEATLTANNVTFTSGFWTNK